MTTLLFLNNKYDNVSTSFTTISNTHNTVKNIQRVTNMFIDICLPDITKCVTPHCYTTHLYVLHDTLRSVTRNNTHCHTTHLYVIHDTLRSVTKNNTHCHTTHLYVIHDTLSSVTRNNTHCHTTHLYVIHDTLNSVTRRILVRVPSGTETFGKNLVFLQYLQYFR